MATIRFAAGGIDFEWDEVKSVANKAKHGVSFEEAATVFLDPFAQFFADRGHRMDESRCIVLGESEHYRLLVVVHVDRRAIVRLISARLATRRERAKLET